jgi:hypothetical protein
MHQFTSLWAYCGGASVALAESVGSAAPSFLLMQKNKKYVELKYRQII